MNKRKRRIARREAWRIYGPSIKTNLVVLGVVVLLVGLIFLAGLHN